MTLKQVIEKHDTTAGKSFDFFIQVYRPRVLGQWCDGIRIYAAASSPTRSRRT